MVSNHLRTRRRCALAAAARLSCGLGALGVASLAHAEATWLGTTDFQWSVTSNWADNRLPASGEAIRFHAGDDGLGFNDLGNPLDVATITFATPDQLINGGTLRVAPNAAIRATVPGSGNLRWFMNQVQLTGATTLSAVGQSGNNATIRDAVKFNNLSGVGNVLVHGAAQYYGASYSGTTTVVSPDSVRFSTLWIGGRLATSGPGEPGETSGQGDYLIGFRGSLQGDGTIGLTAGSRVRIQNQAAILPEIGNTALGPTEASLTINGGLVIESGGTYFASTGNLGATQTDVIHVNGLLDLSAAGDRLLIINNNSNLPPPFVIATYQQRLGEFDVIDVGGPHADMLLTYTSASGAGPGQVIATFTPEPASALLLIGGAAALGARIRRIGQRRAR